MQSFLCVGPGAVGVGVVGFHEDVLHAYHMPLAEARRVVHRAHPEVAPEGVGGADVYVVPSAVHGVVAADMLQAIQQPCHPADAAFREAYFDVGEADGNLGIQPVAGGEHGIAEEQHSDGVGRSIGGGGRRCARAADMHAYDRAGLFARRHDGIPMAGVERRQPQQVRGF